MGVGWANEKRTNRKAKKRRKKRGPIKTKPKKK